MTSVALLIQFIETCIFVYLHNRKVYLEEIFEKRRVFDVIVQTTRQPALLSYVTKSLFGITKYLDKGLLKQICVILVDENGEVAEKLQFELIDSSSTTYLKLPILTRESVRSCLIRLGRVSLPTFRSVNFSLAFQILQEQEDDEEQEEWIVKEVPIVHVQENKRRTILPIFTIAEENSLQRLVVKIETSLL